MILITHIDTGEANKYQGKVYVHNTKGDHFDQLFSN